MFTYRGLPSWVFDTYIPFPTLFKLYYPSESLSSVDSNNL